MPWRENKGVCQFKRMLDGCFWGIEYTQKTLFSWAGILTACAMLYLL